MCGVVGDTPNGLDNFLVPFRVHVCLEKADLLNDFCHLWIRDKHVKIRDEVG